MGDFVHSSNLLSFLSPDACFSVLGSVWSVYQQVGWDMVVSLIRLQDLKWVDL